MRFKLPFFAALLTTFLASHQAQAEDCIFLEQGFSNFQDKGPDSRVRGYICYVIQTTPDQTGVITVQTETEGGDWDVLVGRHFDHDESTMHDILPHSNSDGIADEVVILPVDKGSAWEIVIYPKTDTPSKGCFRYHYFNQKHVLAQAFMKATTLHLAAGKKVDKNLNNTPRADELKPIMLDMRALDGKNLGAMTYDSARYEIDKDLEETFGRDTFVFSVGSSFTETYLSQIGAYSFSNTPKCE